MLKRCYSTLNQLLSDLIVLTAFCSMRARRWKVYHLFPAFLFNQTPGAFRPRYEDSLPLWERCEVLERGRARCSTRSESGGIERNERVAKKWKAFFFPSVIFLTVPLIIWILWKAKASAFLTAVSMRHKSCYLSLYDNLRYSKHAKEKSVKLRRTIDFLTGKFGIRIFYSQPYGQVIKLLFV